MLDSWFGILPLNRINLGLGVLFLLGLSWCISVLANFEVSEYSGILYGQTN